MSRVSCALLVGTLSLAGPRAVAAQATNVLHIRASVLDADQKPAPVSRHALLISDNPATAPPRKVVTGPDGTVDVKLPPGSYTVESDRPFTFNGRAYTWIQVVDIHPGRDAALALTTDNAQIEVGASATPGAAGDALEGDRGRLLATWQDSVVAVWNPSSRASGFVVDRRGLVITTRRAIDEPASVEVQLTPDLKVAARVLAADRVRDVAVLWVDASALGSIAPVPLNCGRPEKAPVAEGQQLFTIGAPLRGPKRVTSAIGGRVEPHEIAADFSVDLDGTGGPVFTVGGQVVGITTFVEDTDVRRGGETRVTPVDDACDVVKSAEEKMRSAVPPSGARLPVEPRRPFPPDALDAAATHRAGAVAPYAMESADFDIAFITPLQAYAARQRFGDANARARRDDSRGPAAMQDQVRMVTEFGGWSEYFAEFPAVVLVRVTPRFAEGFWTKVGRGAAYTQGVALPPIKRLKPGFSRLRAFCGSAEVTPIHPFTITERISETDAVREGLYVFEPGALGPSCGTVKLVLYSEKEPEKGDTRAVDPAIIQKIWQDFEPYRRLPAADPPRGDP